MNNETFPCCPYCASTDYSDYEGYFFCDGCGHPFDMPAESDEDGNILDKEPSNE